MTFNYRLSYYKDEDGEYSNYLACDKSIIDKIIDDHWRNESSPNGLEIIVITNDRGQSIILEHWKKEVFDAYYLPLTSSFHYHKKSRINVVEETLRLFMADEIYALESTLNKTRKENKYVRGDFFFKDHNYRLTKKRTIQELAWLFWYGLPIGGSFNTIFALWLINAPTYTVADVLNPMLFFIGNLLWLPGVILHYQYKRDANGVVVRITRGSDRIYAQSPLVKKMLFKSDILQVTQVKNPAYRLPWAEYGYVQIDFNSGEVINLTNLLVDQLFVLDKFESDNVKKKSVSSGIPLLKKRTQLNSTTSDEKL